MLTGCATSPPQPMSKNAAQVLHGQKMEVITAEPFDFALLNPPMGLLGAIGGASMVSAGKKFIAKNSIEDPSASIAKAVGKYLIQHYEIEDVTSANPSNSDIKLTVKTNFWAFGPTMVSKGKWTLPYTAKILLSNTKTGKIIAIYDCSKKREQGVQSNLNYDEMTQDNAKNIKTHLNEMASECAKDFETLVLAADK